MPDLSTQIEILYRVIGQLDPKYEFGCNPSSRRDAHLPHELQQQQLQQHGALPMHGRPVSLTVRGVPVRWICSFYCLWFSLPLSVWCSSGWIGLFFYWRALSGTACLLEKFTRKPSFFPGRAKSRKGGARCSAIELEGQ